MTKFWVYLLLLFTFPCIGFSKVEFNGLTYQFQMNYPGANDVIILFSFDDYTAKYHMEKDILSEGNFNLSLDIPKIGGSIKPGKYYYRIIVDGIITYDNTNPQKEILPLVGTLSYFEIKNIYLDNLSGPVRIAPLTYRFFYHQDKGSSEPNQILLASDIDSWGLYRHILKPSSEDPNIWYVDIRFDNPGKIQYTYIVDGIWIPDYNNENALQNSVGQDLSVLDVN